MDELEAMLKRNDAVHVQRAGRHSDYLAFTFDGEVSLPHLRSCASALGFGVEHQRISRRPVLVVAPSHGEFRIGFAHRGIQGSKPFFAVSTSRPFKKSERRKIAELFSRLRLKAMVA